MASGIRERPASMVITKTCPACGVTFKISDDEQRYLADVAVLVPQRESGGQG